jgi:hypothetical protein
VQTRSFSRTLLLQRAAAAAKEHAALAALALRAAVRFEESSTATSPRAGAAGGRLERRMSFVDAAARARSSSVSSVNSISSVIMTIDDVVARDGALAAFDHSFSERGELDHINL